MWWGKVGVKNWEKAVILWVGRGDLTPPGARYGCPLKICDKPKGLPVGGGGPDAPDGYENYRTFAIYCAVGRPALWPPESWNIAYCAGNHPSVRCADSAQTAPGPLCRFATSPRPAGSHPQGKPTHIFGLIPKSQRHLSQSPGTVTAPAGAFQRPTGILIPALRPEIDRSLRTIL